jgi:hypothetical protein
MLEISGMDRLSEVWQMSRRDCEIAVAVFSFVDVRERAR